MGKGSGKGRGKGASGGGDVDLTPGGIPYMEQSTSMIIQARVGWRASFLCLLRRHSPHPTS